MTSIDLPATSSHPDAQSCPREVTRTLTSCPADAVAPDTGGIHPDEVRRYPLDPRLESGIDFPQPMYKLLAAIPQDLIPPGVQSVPPNTVSVLMANRGFIEACPVGCKRCPDQRVHLAWGARVRPVYVRETVLGCSWTG